MFIHASMFLIPFILASCYLECGSWTNSTSTDMQTLSPPPNLQNQNLHLCKILGWLVYTQKYLWNFTNNPWDSHLICQGGVKAMTSTRLRRWFPRASEDEIYQSECAWFLSLQKPVIFTGVWRRGMLSPSHRPHEKPKLVQKRWGWRVWLLPTNSSPSSGKLIQNICPILDG